MSGGSSARGGGGLHRELCRAFGHCNRHLARLQHNLRETKKFFRDVKYSQGAAVFPVASAAAAAAAAGGNGCAGPASEETPPLPPLPLPLPPPPPPPPDPDSAPSGGVAPLQAECNSAAGFLKKTPLYPPLFSLPLPLIQNEK
ncbi:dual serine/threonine and tyrosine protein kinase-like [Sceloporus undulatus]|uniref:dual serine/threonine and tyrosine protein kinase-like n=1 Tax=Sceloporus undulatus TaxID=8520 RepID=UPI001C4ADEE0|nr:dual serine/threonine and tyrosine protein kinase-like [Sceloporus undulatus]